MLERLVSYFSAISVLDGYFPDAISRSINSILGRAVLGRVERIGLFSVFMLMSISYWSVIEWVSRFFWDRIVCWQTADFMRYYKKAVAEKPYMRGRSIGSCFPTTAFFYYSTAFKEKYLNLSISYIAFRVVIMTLYSFPLILQILSNHENSPGNIQ